MAASTGKAKAKQKVVKLKKDKRILPLGSRQLKDAVVSLGYTTPRILPATKLKGSTSELKERLGGKGAGLAFMSRLKIPVPPAFNLGTAVCGLYLGRQKLPEPLLKQIKDALSGLETAQKKEFGSKTDPLLISVRSGARVSMPGMMDTILNLGLNRSITESLASRSPEKARFWWDCFRRLVQMFSEVVLQAEYSQFEDVIQAWKQKEGVSSDADLSAKALQNICSEYLEILKKSGKTFPEEPWDQLLMAIEAVFRSWNTERATHYRSLNSIPEEWGTAVTVQSMVFGNLNDQSGTGVVFTRDPSTGEKKLYGEYLLNAQGEDVVAGIRTPKSIDQMKSEMPEAYADLTKTLKRLEDHFIEVQDVEFTIENSRLFILQTRSAKRSAAASIEHAVQFVSEKRIRPEQALERIGYDQVKQLLHPTLKADNTVKPFVRGLPASPGAVSGRAVFDPEAAVTWARSGQKVILVRRETSPEDIMGMSVAEGILTSTGGMTSHAAVVGRGMGKSCVVGCTELQVNENTKQAEACGTSFEEGDVITLNGTNGDVFLGELSTEPQKWGRSAQTFFAWADKVAKIPVLANADTPEQARVSVALGARGIGLCRTEHMFFDKERIRKFRSMVLSDQAEERSRLADDLLNFQKEDFIGIFKEMEGFSVCVRLLDPPLHEFLPKLEDTEELETLARESSVKIEKLRSRILQLHETNPMLGHRGCRLGITFPEVYHMQIRALAESLAETTLKNIEVELKIMIPLVMTKEELEYLLVDLKGVFLDSLAKKLDPKRMKSALRFVKWGTMIELPRACLIAKDLAKLVDFFSFGTNDLTQTGLGLSRDDGAKFIPAYLEKKLMAADPFESLDTEGLGRLIEMAVTEGRKANPKIEIGICGEHGGDPKSIRFFRKLGFDSVSCSPFRVPIARLAVARATLEDKNRGK